MVTRCPQCEAQVVDGQSAFCNKCGAPLPLNKGEKESDREEKTAVLTPTNPVKICPHCNEPVFDENRYYCKKCGGYIRGGEYGTQVPDEKNTSKPVVEKPVIIPGIYQNTENTLPEKQQPTVMGKNPARFKPEINPYFLIFIIVGIIILAFAVIILSGSGNGVAPGGNSGNSLQSDNNLPVVDLSSIALTISDFPQGWAETTRGGSENSYSAQFIETSGENPGLVEINITQYASTDAAGLQFILRRWQSSGVDVEAINLGNEGFGFIDVDYVVVVFRKGPIIVTVEDTRSEYQFNPTINNAKNYAQIMADRIK